MSKPDKWMPLYIADYLAATTRLSTEQHGAYLLLLLDYWRNGPPPDEDETLAAITGLPLARWKQQRPILLRFFTIEDGTWRQKRADKELGEWAEYINQKVAAGKASAKAREQRKPQRSGNGKPTPVPTDEPTEHQQTGEPSPSPSSSLRSEDPPTPLAEGGSDLQSDGAEDDDAQPRYRDPPRQDDPKPERPSRANGTSPRQQARQAAEQAEAAEAAEVRQRRDALWRPRLEQFQATGRWDSAWGPAPSLNPAVREAGVLLPISLWDEFRAIARARAGPGGKAA